MKRENEWRRRGREKGERGGEEGGEEGGRGNKVLMSNIPIGRGKILN